MEGSAAMNIIVKRIRAGEYDVFDAKTKEHVAHITKAGTHLDDYPWDWYLEYSIWPQVTGRRSGVTDTMRSAKERISLVLASREIVQ
jgi:hypothetical protein